MIVDCPPEIAINAIKGSDDYICWLVPNNSHQKCKYDKKFTEIANLKENEGKLFLRVQQGSDTFFCETHKLDHMGCICRVYQRRLVWTKVNATKEELIIEFKKCFDRYSRHRISRQSSLSVSSEDLAAKNFTPGSPTTRIRHKTIHSNPLHVLHEQNPHMSEKDEVKLRRTTSD